MSDMLHGDFRKNILRRDLSDIVACGRHIHNTPFLGQISSCGTQVLKLNLYMTKMTLKTDYYEVNTQIAILLGNLFDNDLNHSVILVSGAPSTAIEKQKSPRCKVIRTNA